MSTTVQLAGNNISGLVQASHGNYQAATDGTYTVDTRDVAVCLAMGMLYIRKNTTTYSTYPVAPAAASATRFVASTTLSSGAVAIGAQPDVMRPATLVIGQLASPGPSAGSIAITYIGNDGVSTTDTFNLVNASVAPYTVSLSKGVAKFSTIVVSGLTGTGYLTLGSTAALALPVAPSTVDVVVNKETIDTGDEAVGTLSTTITGVITPTTAPNATHTYSFMYSSIAPEA